MREKQRATRTLRHSDTGRWFLEDAKFVKWKEEPGWLWIRGNCKLFRVRSRDKCLTSSSRYRKDHPATPNFGIAYFYFDFRDEQKQLVENMLRSIIMQLSEQSPTPYSVLDEHFKSCQGGKFPTYDDLLAMLDTILGQFTGTYIILDALDECSEHDELVKFISTLCGWGKPVHLLVASQPRIIFLDSAAFDGASVVVLEPAATHADILQFVNSELKLNSKLKHIQKAKDAAPKIVGKSNGMFRMAACLLQELTQKRVDTNVDKILAKLPNNLFGIYSRFLQPIDEDDFVYVAALLRWLAFSARHVTLRQLDEALAINFSEPDRWVFEPEGRGRVEVVSGLLEGLVTVVPATATVSDQHQASVTLAHSSVRDYITSKTFLDEYKHDMGKAPSHTFLAQSCVAYLLYFEHKALNADTFPQYPLARYAAMFWFHHLRRCHDRGILRRSTMQLLEDGSQQFVSLNCIFDFNNSWSGTDWSRHAPSPLILCSKIGYVEGVGFLLDHGTNVDAARGELGNALRVAVRTGHADIVRVLLEKGASANAGGRPNSSPLQLAVWNDDVDSVRVLLEHGANTNVKDRQGSSLLRHVARNGHVDISRILLEHGADVNALDRDGDSALQSAALTGHGDIVRICLENGADVNAAGGEYGSALEGAARTSHVDIVGILLEHGADVNTTSRIYGSALQAAALFGHESTVCSLLEHGADVNAAGGVYGSALQGAAQYGSLDTVRLLLENGADLNAAGGKLGSVLQSAARNGHVEVVHILLEHGADVNTVGGEYASTQRCALHHAAHEGHVEIVRILLEHGGNVSAADRDGDSALQAAAWEGHIVIVRLLLEHGADVNATGGRYSALAAASAKGHGEIVKLLREHGALDTESSEDSESGEDSESDEDSE
ncbi:ankyrin repeat-containing domain protein [Mycena polygramma]|nr:ankyrin repeat-containing domain protein [Mycena polygramma]